MSEQTKIAWCDSTLNWWEGCTRISEGCRFCYAEARDKRFTGGKLWGKGAPRRKSKSAVKSALAMNRKPWICDKCGEARANSHEACCWTEENPVTSHRRRIFSLSLGDWLDDEVPVEWLARMLDTIRQCDQVVWILCSKRPENFFSRMLEAQATAANSLPEFRPLMVWIGDWLDGVPPSNIILLTSVENQEMADKRIPELLKIPAVCHGLSLEPLLGPVTINQWGAGGPTLPTLEWLIIGCESGAKRRDCKLAWVRNLVAQAEHAGVARFVKQLQDSEGLVCKDVSEFPDDLQIQQFPNL